MLCLVVIRGLQKSQGKEMESVCGDVLVLPKNFEEEKNSET